MYKRCVYSVILTRAYTVFYDVRHGISRKALVVSILPQGTYMRVSRYEKYDLYIRVIVLVCVRVWVCFFYTERYTVNAYGCISYDTLYIYNTVTGRLLCVIEVTAVRTRTVPVAVMFVCILPSGVYFWERYVPRLTCE